MGVPAAKVFFAEVRALCAEAAERWGLEGPGERRSDLLLATSRYSGGGLTYEFYFEWFEVHVKVSAVLETETGKMKADVEQLAIAAGVVEKGGGVSYSAQNQKQMKKSLEGQVRYVELLHPFLSGDREAAEELMRKAGAR
ncbi:hypothetical protein J7E95_33620 [Streptomyces sp. ISL-14]|nr:hypothetical protein [Streptomyces sp. ISL-14]